VTIYVPGDLHRKIKRADLAVSKICQDALREAVGEVLPTDDELTEGQILGREIDAMRGRLRRIADIVEERL